MHNTVEELGDDVEHNHSEKLPNVREPYVL